MQPWKKNFFTIWCGQAVSQLSSSILQFAIVWYLTDTTGSPLVLSAAMLAGFLPNGILGPFIGVYIDRCSRKNIMILSDLGIAAVSFLLSIAGWMGEIPLSLILAVLVARSIGSAFHNPCLQAVTPQIVPSEELTKCAGYSQTLQSISQLLSPAIAAVLYSAWNLSGIILLDVLGAVFAVMTLCISKIPTRPASNQLERPHLLKEALEGWQILRSKRGVLGLVFVAMLYSMALMPVSTLFPLMSMSYFGGTSYHASLAEITFSSGLLLGSLILSWWGGTQNKIYTIVASFSLMSVSLFISGLLPSSGFWLFCLCSFLMGISGPFYWGMYTPLLQQTFGSDCLGRILSLSNSMMFLCSPIGLSISGLFAQKYGVENWFLIAGGMTLLGGMICLLSPEIRRCGLPPENNFS